jgi:hypothetical protein
MLAAAGDGTCGLFVCCAVLPQQPKRSIAMLPLHPPISGMGGPVAGMHAFAGAGVGWHAGTAGSMVLYSQVRLAFSLL